jgi:hypothetical protein
MKISKLAAATLIPATIAGVSLTAVPFAEAAPAVPAHTRVVHHATPAKPQHARHHRAHHAHAVARSAAKDAATTPSQDSQAASGQAGTTPAESSTASQPLSAGMSSFEQCVAWRESGDNPVASSAGLFGILPSTWAQLGYPGTAGQASVALQKVAFTRLYAEYGAQPWAPSDGC